MGTSISPLEILVVDDSHSQAEAWAKVIRNTFKANVKVAVELSGKDALRNFSNKIVRDGLPYHLVITDYNMEQIGDMNGLELCCSIKKINKISDFNPRVVLLSGYTDEVYNQLEKIPKGSQPDEVMEKPVDWEGLLFPYIDELQSQRISGEMDY